MRTRTIAIAILVLSAGAAPLVAQQGATADHGAHGTDADHAQHQAGTPGMPTLAGQDAFAAIGEVVRLLEADPSTDWSRVNLERLRRHLVDMHEVTLRSRVTETAVPGGARMEVTGEGRTMDAIRRMVRAHVAQLAGSRSLSASAEDIPGGVRLTVVSTRPTHARAVARIRGLGFIGFMIEGEHHGPHHLALARGDLPAGHAH